ncbi:MAG TPA: NUDIX domain-containing protein [Bacteroidia bacterium]
MVKVFSNNKTICFTSNIMDYPQKEDTILIRIHSLDELQLLYDELVTKNQFMEVYFYYENEKILLSTFSSAFKIIEAAGGLVKNKKGEYLFIFRNGKWDLPKGKVEKEEAIPMAAIREVEEECGVDQLKIVKELESSYHTYELDGKAVLKRTFWFEMDCDDSSQLVPQTEEGITEVKWLSKNELKKVYANTYESVKEVLKNIPA